jgi:hypothetical protein
VPDALEVSTVSVLRSDQLDFDTKLFHCCYERKRSSSSNTAQLIRVLIHLEGEILEFARALDLKHNRFPRFDCAEHLLQL